MSHSLVEIYSRHPMTHQEAHDYLTRVRRHIECSWNDWAWDVDEITFTKAVRIVGAARQIIRLESLLAGNEVRP